MTKEEKTSKDIFRLIKDKQDDLVLAATNIAFYLMPYKPDADLPKVVDDVTGNLLELPQGAFSLGEIQKKAGVSLTPDLKTEGIQGYGSRASRRVFVTEENFDIDFTVQEIRKQAYEMFFGLDDADITTSGKATRMVKRASGSIRYYTLVGIAVDEAFSGEIYPFWVFPKVAVTKKGKMDLAEAQEMGMPMTFTMFEANGVQFEIGLAGAGWPALAKKAGFMDKATEGTTGASSSVSTPGSTPTPTTGH